MKPSPRVLSLDIHQLEPAFDMLSAFDPCDHDGPCFSFLDLTTAAVFTTEDEKNI